MLIVCRQDIFFNDPSFGVRRADYLEFASHGCDYCFWMIHYRNRQGQPRLAKKFPISTKEDLDKPHSLDTNIGRQEWRPGLPCQLNYCHFFFQPHQPIRERHGL